VPEANHVDQWRIADELRDRSQFGFAADQRLIGVRAGRVRCFPRGWTAEPSGVHRHLCNRSYLKR